MFLRLIALILLIPSALQAQSMTAAQALQRVQARYPAPPNPGTVDTIKAGDPSTIVTGIATTFLDTMDLLREASRRGDNLVISHEPTFYNHRDDPAFFLSDPVYQEKLAYIQQHHMVVFRLHDEIHDATPDPIALALIRSLGWEAYIKPPNEPLDPFFATIPTTTLAELARTIQAKLHIQTMRIVGDPDLAVTHVALRPGAAGMQQHVLALRQANVDLLIAGEASEWETVEYVRDASAQGRHKALILLGHQISEEPGMEQCAKDLRELFPKLQVDHILAGQPMWNPEHPPTHPAARP